MDLFAYILFDLESITIGISDIWTDFSNDSIYKKDRRNAFHDMPSFHLFIRNIMQKMDNPWITRRNNKASNIPVNTLRVSLEGSII